MRTVFQRAANLALVTTRNRLAYQAAIETSEHLVDEVRRRREGRESRIRISAALADHPEHILGMCAWCARARVRDDVWLPMPEGLEEELLRRRGSLLTHTICPDCARGAR